MRRFPFGFSLAWLLGTITIVVILALLATAQDQRIVFNTIALGAGAAFIAIPLGMAMAWAIDASSFSSRLLLLACIGLLGTPLIIHASAWDSAFGKLGWLTSQQGQILKPLLTGWSAAIWIQAMAATPQIAVLFLIARSLGKRSYEEQALLEANPLSVFWHVSLPHWMPLVIAATLWTILSAAREIAVTDLYQIGTLAEQVYLGFSLGPLASSNLNWTPEEIRRAENLGILVPVLTIGWLALGGLWLFQRFLNNSNDANQHNSNSNTRPNFPQTISSPLRKCVAIGLLLLVVAVPVGNLLLRASFQVLNVDGSPTPGYSLSQIPVALDRAIRDQRFAFFWSTAISLTATCFILLSAIAATWFARRSKLCSLLLLIGLALLCAVPGPLLGKGVAFLFANSQSEGLLWLYNYTIFAPVCTNILFCWPIGALLVSYLLYSVPTQTLESAQTEGVGQWNQLIHLVVAGNGRALLGCGLIVFTICFGELAASRLVLPAGIATIPGSLLGFMHAGVDEMTAALTIVTSAGLILITLIGWRLARLNNRGFGSQ